MDNISTNAQNNSSEDQMTKLIIISSYGLYGGLGAIFSLLLICFQLIGFKKRKPYEYIIFAIALVNLINCVCKFSSNAYAVAKHSDCFCKFSGLLLTILTCATTMLLTVNMLHRYLSLYHPVIAKKISTNRGIVLCTTLPILINVVCYTPLLSFDAFGWDTMGTCSMKPFMQNSRWIMLCGVVLFSCNIVNIVLGVLVICKIRAHRSQMQDNFKSKVVKESKQIVRLTLILTLYVMVNNLSGLVIRLLPLGTTPNLWIPRISVVSNTSYVSMMPLFIVINHYKKNVTILFKRATSQVSPVELANLKIVKGNGLIRT